MMPCRVRLPAGLLREELDDSRLVGVGPAA